MKPRFALHDRVTIKRPIVVTACATKIGSGERAKIVDIDPETEAVIIQLEHYFPDLHCRRNLVELEYPHHYIRPDRANLTTVIKPMLQCLALIASFAALSVSGSSRSGETMAETASHKASCYYRSVGFFNTAAITALDRG